MPKTEFLKEKDTLSCVMEIFKSFSTTENKLNCIIVTKKGASDETPLTILTEADIPVILEYI